MATALFFAALVLVHTQHEAWRDEVHCWSVGRNSAGLWDLLVGDRRYDGHPFLWYYLAYLVSRVAYGVVGLHALTIIISTSAAYLWMRRAPAPRLVRLSLLPAYLFFYEYGVVCRSYGLGVLLLFCFCALYDRRHVKYGRLALILVLLALTSAYGAIMAGALGVFLFTRGIRIVRQDPTAHLLATRRGYWTGLVVFVCGIAFTAWSSLPPKDGYWAQVWYTDQMGWKNVQKALVDFWWAFLPRNLDWYSIRYPGVDSPKLAEWIPYFGASLLLAWVVALRRAPMIALGFLVAAAAMGFFQQAKYPGGLRHVGNIYLLLLACVWLVKSELGQRAKPYAAWTLLAVCHAVQIPGTYNAASADWHRPFSGSVEAARFLERLPSRDLLIIGTNDFAVSPVAGYLDHSFVFADTGDYGQSVVSHNRRVALTQDGILSLAKNNLAGRSRVLLILNYALYRSVPHLHIKLLHTTAPSIVSEERFFIYEVRAL